MIYFIALAACAATLLGGLFALRFRDKLHLILGFSAGAVIGVAFFDLLPEAIDLGSSHYDTSTVTALVALGFGTFMILDRSILFHSHDHNESHEDHNPESRGKLGAASFAIHSFLDGAAIGLAFQVSAAVGTIVAVAVLVHDFSDGINTVNLILKNKGKSASALKWLIVDAAAPVIGVVAASLVAVPEHVLGIILSLFCGFFLYIGASDLLPESHHNHPTFWTTLSIVCGMTVFYIVIKLVGI